MSSSGPSFQDRMRFLSIYLEEDEIRADLLFDSLSELQKDMYHSWQDLQEIRLEKLERLRARINGALEKSNMLPKKQSRIA